MVLSDLPLASIWLIVVVLGLGVYGLRLSFIHLHGLLDAFPPRLERALTFIPAAVLAALIFPELFVLDGSVVGTVLDVRVLAGGLAAVTAWRTGSMMATIGIGMGVLWTATFLVG